MPVPTDRRYKDTHEWALPQGDAVVVGITQAAADALTDVTFVDLPAVGSIFVAGQEAGEIESVKATSSIYAPIGGTVSEVNPQLSKDPGLVNRDPFGEAWMFKLKPAVAADLAKLLDAAAYDAQAH